MIVVVLAVTPERLRGVLTRWLFEISIGVYVGYVSARVREHLWNRIVDDCGHGRAIMVWSKRSEQGFGIQVHNHEWDAVDLDGLVVMRRQSKEARELRSLKRKRGSGIGVDCLGEPKSGEVSVATSGKGRLQSKAGRRRRYQNAVEKRHRGKADAD